MNNPSKIIRKVAIWAVIVAFGCLLVISVRRNALLENSLILMADENSNSDLDETALIADDSFGEVDGLADEPDAKAVTPKKQLELRLAPKVKASNGNSNDAIATNPQSNANETSVPSTAEDEIIAKREDELLSLEMELQELSAKLGPMHPKLRALKIKIEMLVDWLKEHQRTNNRTLVLKIHDGLQPVQVTSVLRELFVQKANVTCNDSRDRVFATVTGTTTRAETLSVMNEIENAAKRLGCVPEVSSVRHRDGFPTDEQDAEFDRQAKQLALEFRNAKPEEKTQIRSKLEAITKNHFFYRQQRRKREFESLGQRVDKLKAMHVRREANRADIIRRRMDELLDPEADLKWDLIEAKAVEVVDSTNSTTEKPELRAASSPLSESPNLPGQNEKAKSPAPTYNGMTLDEAVHLMVTDRNLEKLTDAVLAANHLYDLGDPRELVRAVLQMMRFSGSVGINVGRQHVGLNEASVVLFLHFPSDLVIEEIVTELKHEGKRKPVRDFFLFFFTELFESSRCQRLNNGRKNGAIVFFRSGSDAGFGGSPIEGNPNQFKSNHRDDR